MKTRRAIRRVFYPLVLVGPAMKLSIRTQRRVIESDGVAKDARDAVIAVAFFIACAAVIALSGPADHVQVFEDFKFAQASE